MTTDDAAPGSDAATPGGGSAADSDETLMERYRDGDAGAFDRLYARHRGRLHRYLLRQCGEHGVADELFQDVWMRLIDARAGYQAKARFTTWLFQIAHNRLIDHYRAQPRGRTVSFDDDGCDLAAVPAARTADPAVRVESRQHARRLLDWLGALPPAQREAFLLQHEGELSLDEIASATGVGRETVKSRLRYAIARLRAQWLANESPAPPMSEAAARQVQAAPAAPAAAHALRGHAGGAGTVDPAAAHAVLRTGQAAIPFGPNDPGAQA
ncbi:MAG: RNA polymerase sigma factor [Lautropia sp.]